MFSVLNIKVFIFKIYVIKYIYEIWVNDCFYVEKISFEGVLYLLKI